MLHIYYTFCYYVHQNKKQLNKFTLYEKDIKAIRKEKMLFCFELNKKYIRVADFDLHVLIVRMAVSSEF